MKWDVRSKESSDGKLTVIKKRKLHIVILKQQRIKSRRFYSSVVNGFDKYILTTLWVKSSVREILVTTIFDCHKGCPLLEGIDIRNEVNYLN